MSHNTDNFRVIFLGYLLIVCGNNAIHCKGLFKVIVHFFIQYPLRRVRVKKIILELSAEKRFVFPEELIYLFLSNNDSYTVVGVSFSALTARKIRGKF